MLELWETPSTLSLPSPPGSLWLEVVSPDRVQSMGQIEQKKKWAQARIKILIIYLINMYKEDLALNNLQWLICHKNQTNSYIFNKYVYQT